MKYISLLLFFSFSVFAASGTLELGGFPTRTNVQTFSPTLSTASGVSSSAFNWYQDGKWAHVAGQLGFSAAGSATALTITLPNGCIIDTAELVGGTNTGNATATIVGDGVWFDNGTAWKAIWPKFATTTTVGFWDVNQAFANNEAANGDGLNFRIRVPCVGWH